MKNDSSKSKTVENLRLPMCSYGFRSGWARAVVDGVAMKLYTSQSAQTDYNEHYRRVCEQFAAGAGEVA